MAKKIHNNDNEKQNGGGQKNKDGSIIAILKIDMHCEGCAKKIVKNVRSIEGVESVKRGNNDFNKITVTGKVNPVKLRENVEQKLEKKVELISPVTNKQTDDKTVIVKDESKPKQIPVTTTVLKMPLHCQGCITKIQKTVRKTEGFMEMSIDKNKELVMVKGKIDVNALITTLRNKFKIKVEVVPVKDGDNNGGKKGKAGAGGDREGNESGGAGAMQRIEGHQYLVGPNQYMYPQYVYDQPQYPFNYNMHAPQMFNDENPNACVVM